MWDTSSDEENENANPLIRRRTFRRCTNHSFESMFEFNERFRMSTVKLQLLLNDIGHRLHRRTNRSKALPAKLALCVALHWLGTGKQYYSVADVHVIGKASVCLSVHNVVTAVNAIKFPQVVDWPEDMVQVSAAFYAIAGMPNVVGCVDGTLIKIDSPKDNEVQYVDRHGNHYLNCIVVCGPDCSFCYVSARWLGSVHDARVLRNSTLNQRMEEGWRPVPGAIILADSGYPLKEWLIPPVMNAPQDPAVVRFNRAHKFTRRLVENSLGNLKKKFPCLKHLRIKPLFAAQVFKCCTALCNIARSEDGVQPFIETDEEQDDVEMDHNDVNIHPAAQQRLSCHIVRKLKHLGITHHQCFGTQGSHHCKGACSKLSLRLRDWPAASSNQKAAHFQPRVYKERMSMDAAAGEDDVSESCVVFECTHKSWVENIDPEKLQVLADMYDSGSCTDVVIQCTDHHLIHAHRDVLAARSQLFSLALKKSSRRCSVLEVKYLPFKYVKALVDLMYHNRVVVERTDARSLMYLMEQFQLRGAFGQMGPYGLLARLSGAKMLGEHFDRLYEYTIATPVPKMRQPRGMQRPVAESRSTFLPRGRAKVCKPDTATNREQVKQETQSPVAESRSTFLPRGEAKVCKPDTAANHEQVKQETQSPVAESRSTFLPRGEAKVCKLDTAANHEQQTAVRREPASLGCLVQEGQLQVEQAEARRELQQSAAVHNTRSKRIKVEAEEPCHAAVATSQRASGRKSDRKSSASTSKAASAPVAVPSTPLAKRISKAKRIPAATHSVSSLNAPTQALVPRFANVDSQGNKIPRPPNAFMIFGQDFRKLLAEESAGDSNKVISVALGQAWGGLSDCERAAYYELQETYKQAHQAHFPGYTYSPAQARRLKALRKRTC